MCADRHARHATSLSISIITLLLQRAATMRLSTEGVLMKRMLHGFWLAIAVCVFGPSLVWAQVDRATLSGVVKDTNGGVLPGTTVAATNVATNVEARQQTTETGAYQIVNLIPGRYRLEVELSGFKKSSQVVTLEVGQRARVDVELEVGSFAE